MTKFQLAVGKKYKDMIFKGYDFRTEQFILEKNGVEVKRRCLYNKKGEYYFKIKDIRYYFDKFE